MKKNFNFRMKKIQAKKKRDRAENDAAEAALIAAPHDGQQVRNLLDNDDDTPDLFN